MINASANFKNIVDGDSRSPLVALFIDSVPYGVDKIKSIKLTMGACGAQPLSGSLFIPSVEAVIAEELSSSVLEGKELFLRVGFRGLSSDDRISFGPFIVSSVANSNGETTINAIGTLSTFGSQTATVSSTDISDIIDEVADFLENNVGVTTRLQGVTATGSLKEVPTGTWRDVMQEIAIALGGFVTEDYVGCWTIAKFASGSIVDVAPDRSQRAPEYGQAYTLEGTTVESGSIEMTMGNPLIEPWDVLRITDLNGDTHLLPCLNITHTFNGGLETTVEATVETAIQENAKIEGPVNGIVQHFWFDGAGAHVTQVEKQEYIDDPDSAGGNTLITADGMTVRDGTETLARFTKDLVQVGESTGGRLSVTSDGITLYNDDSMPIFSVADSGGNTEQWVRETPYASGRGRVVHFLSGEPKYGESIIVTWGFGSNTYTTTFTTGTTETISLEPVEISITYAYRTSGQRNINVIFVGEKGPQAVLRIDTISYLTQVASSSLTFGSRSGTLQGNFSATIGEGVIARYDNQVAVGMYNENLPDDIFEVGVGSDDTNRKTMLAVTGDGIYSAGHAEIGGTLSVGGKTLLDLTYPVGAIYMSVSSTSPATLFGGTWVQLKDRFLLGAGDTYTAGAKDGAATVTLTGAQSGVHQHTHAFTQPSVTGGSHSHYLNYRSKTLASGSSYDRPASVGSGTANGYTTSSTSHTHTVSGGAVGNTTVANATEAHNNMPPYLVVYMWQRTA